MNFLKLLIAGALPIVLSSLLFLVQARTRMQNWKFWQKQVCAGVLFGLASYAATLLSVNMYGVLFNVRDAAPIVAALIFGGPAGMIAGIIGAIGRYCMIYFHTGAYSVIACSLACLFSGCFAAFCRKYLFGKRIPLWPAGVVIVLICEAVHMLLILVTHLDYIQPAFDFVSSCMFPIMLATSISVGVSLYIIQKLQVNTVTNRPVRSMSSAISTWLAVTASCGFLLTALVTYTVETVVGYNDISTMLENAILEGKEELEALESAGSRELPDNIRILEHGGLYILSKNGQLLAGPHKELPKNFQLSTLLANGPTSITRIGTNSGEICYKYAEDGDYIFVASVPLEEAMKLRSSSSFVLIMIEFVIYLIMYVMVYYQTKSIMLRGVRSISRTIAQIPGGENSLKSDSQKESESFASLSEDIINTADYLKRYVEKTEDIRTQIYHDLRKAETLMVPSVFPPFPEEDAFSLYGHLIPGTKGSGCFYDYFIMPSSKLCILFGQAEETGFQALLGALEVKNSLHGLIRSGLSLPQSMKQANERIMEAFGGKMKASVWAAILNFKTGDLEYINANTNHPIFNLNNAGTRINEKKSPALGTSQESVFSLKHLKLGPGDRICLFSKGISDAENVSGSQFGCDRIQSVLHAYKYDESKEAVEAVLRDLKTFTASRRMEQDQCILEIELKSLRTRDTITLRPDKSSMDKLVHFVERRTRKLHLTPLEETRLSMVMDAMYNVAVNYSGATRIRVTIDRKDDGIEVALHDNGTYNMNDQKKYFQEITSNPSPSYGGLNLYLIRQFATLSGEDVDGEHIIRALIDSRELKPAGSAEKAGTASTAQTVGITDGSVEAVDSSAEKADPESSTGEN